MTAERLAFALKLKHKLSPPQPPTPGHKGVSHYSLAVHFLVLQSIDFSQRKKTSVRRGLDIVGYLFNMGLVSVVWVFFWAGDLNRVAHFELSC